MTNTHATVGQAVVRVFPQYGHVKDLAELGRVILEQIQLDPTMLDHMLGVQSVYDPKHGRIISWWDRKKSADRTALLQQLIAEGGAILQLLQQRYAIQDLLDAQELRHIQTQLAIEMQQTQIHQERYKQAETESTAVLLKEATDTAVFP
jgi:hypothetical protein